MRPLLSIRSHLLLACLLALLTTPVPAADTERSGYRVDDFTLADTAGKTHALKDYRDRKAVVVVFLGTQCPINNAFLPRLAELHKTYSGKGVAFLAVNANHQDTPQRIAEHAREHKLSFPVLRDQDNRVADIFRAERTPEAFVVAGGKVVYRGRIDDQFGYRHRRDEPTTHELADALDDVLAGRPVRVAVTEVEGCVIARAVKTKTDGAVTFTKHVAAILQKNCQECHRPGQIGPMPLITYADAVDWSATMREVVDQGRMPPWHADPKHGKFANDRRLSKSDRETLISWIDGGMPRGDDKDLPRTPAFADGWRIGKPDAVFEMPLAYTVPPKSQRKSLRYQYSLVKTDFKEDVWVQAAEARPGNRKVVHHIIVYVQNPGRGRDRIDGIGDGFLAAYAPGDMPAIFPAGAAKKVAKGALLVFQLHYTPTGTEETDRSSVGLIFAKKPPPSEARTRSIAARGLSIPAGAPDHKVTSTTTFRQEIQLLSLLPHMHLRGKSFEYRAVFPDGQEQVLLRVPLYDFNWQTIYRLDKPLTLPAGTRINCLASFDNSAANKNNPDPKKNVRWGDQTWEEMMIGFVDYVYTSKSP
jgi:peroxiredoxin